MLLAIDTCGALGGVALGSASASGAPEFWFRELAGKTFSERLLTTIEEVLEVASVALDQLSGVVVVSGPGSFTGIRIGVSAAKGLCEGLGIPVIALSRLELLARQTDDGSAVAVLDAGRSEFFAGFYREGVCETEALLTRDALSQAVVGGELPVVVCEETVFGAVVGLKPTLVFAPTAVDALKLGVRRFQDRLFDDVSALEANYLRRSENEMLARVAEHAAGRREQVSKPVE